ncbi:MAG: diaminopimelate epimerase [Lachnospiraceae bacterium]|nr:diaminopimelate epimerase [Lachnospiraceae bacterium]
MKFTKMHGCGNDYVYVSLFDEEVPNPEKTSIEVSDRHFGIGSDGLIMIGPSDVADFRMHMYNADGSRGKMCGNGIRCVAKFVYDKKMTDKEVITVETDAGIKTLELNVKDGVCETIKVDMGAPILTPSEIPVKFDGERMVAESVVVDGKSYEMTAVSMGNPHCIIFVDDVKPLNLIQDGPAFEKNPIFPEGVNTEFIHVISRNEIDMRVWERGSGETFACGTGACASVVASVLNGKCDESVKVHLLGGDLDIVYDRDKNTVFMTGPATIVFEGEI